MKGKIFCLNFPFFFFLYIINNNTLFHTLFQQLCVNQSISRHITVILFHSLEFQLPTYLEARKE